MGAAALHDGAAEKPFGPGHRQQRAGTQGASRLAEDGDVAGVAAKGADVVPHPLERGELIE